MGISILLSSLLLGEFEPTTANVLPQLGNLQSHFIQSCSTNGLISNVRPAMLKIFCHEVKKRKMMSLDHCLPVESMPLTRPADKPRG